MSTDRPSSRASLSPFGAVTARARQSGAAPPVLAKSVALTEFPGRILVVDDDAAVQAVVAEVLRREGYQVDCAEDGEAGWQALRADPLDLLITDHEMPRLSGLDLLRRVRAVPLALPVILMSGNMPADAPDLIALLPPCAALKKPFSVRELLDKVRAFMAVKTQAGEDRVREALAGVRASATLPIPRARA